MADNPRILLVVETRRIRRDGETFARSTLDRIGTVPADFVGPTDRRRFFVGIRKTILPMVPPGLVRSEVLGCCVQLEVPRYEGHDFRAVELEWIYPKDQPGILLLNDDPVCALAFKGFDADYDWLARLDRRQSCPLCRGTAYLDIRFEVTSDLSFSLACGRSNCGFACGTLDLYRHRAAKADARISPQSGRFT